jgi:hypothetical protein
MFDAVPEINSTNMIAMQVDFLVAIAEGYVEIRVFCEAAGESGRCAA